MNQIFNRFVRLIRSSGLGTDSDEDRDFAESWKELNEFLNDGFQESGEVYSNGENRAEGIPPSLKKDYRILGLDNFTTFTVIKKRYIYLIRENHPDKFAHDPERQARATERIKSINSAFEHIKQWENDRK